MKARPQSVQQRLLPIIYQAGGGIVLVLIFWLVITRVPVVRDMIGEIPFPLYFTLHELLSAVILTIIMLMLVSFGTRMEAGLGVVVTGFPQSGQILKLIVFLIVIGIAYGAYRPLLEHYWGDLYWVYPVVFLVVFLVVLGTLGYTIYTHMDRLGTLLVVAKDLFGPKETVTKPTAIPGAGGFPCAACGATNKVGATFCTSCGARFSPAEIVGSRCQGCGAALKPGSRFCASCGSGVGEGGS